MVLLKIEYVHGENNNYIVNGKERIILALYIYNEYSN